jgi:hypothetical protein
MTSSEDLLIVAYTYLKKYRLFWISASVLFVFVAAVAFVWPVSRGNEIVEVRESNALPTSSISLNEDLDLFLKNKRWGTSLQEVIKSSGMATSTQLNPILKEMGYVGLISSGKENYVLLMLSDSTTRRVELGDELVDGRMLSEIGRNSITLTSMNQEKEILLLFPEVTKLNPSELEKEYSK